MTYDEVELPDEGGLYPLDYADELSITLVENQLDDPLMAFREMIANGLDAQERGKEVYKLTISPKEVKGEDWGHGIENAKLFRQIGKNVKHYAEKAIGRYGIGRLSFLSIGKQVYFITNNGEVGWIFRLQRHPVSGRPVMNDPEPRRADKFLPHRGTQVLIKDITAELRDQDIANKMRRRFALRIIKGAQIYINNELLTPNFKFDPTEHFIARLSGGKTKQEQERREITGNLVEDEEASGQVDIYVDHIFIATVSIDPSRGFTGWVNCNALQLDLSRNQIKMDDLYKEFLSKLRQEAARRFKTKDLTVSEFERVFSKKLDKLLNDFLKEKGWMPKFAVPITQSKGKELVPKLEEDEQGGTTMGERQCGTVPPNAPGKSKPAKQTSELQEANKKEEENLPIINTDAGDGMPPLYYLPKNNPGAIWNNKTHPLQVRLDSKSNITVKEKLASIAPYFGHVLVKFHPDYDTMTDEQKEMEANKCTLQILYSARVLTDKTRTDKH